MMMDSNKQPSFSLFPLDNEAIRLYREYYINRDFFKKMDKLIEAGLLVLGDDGNFNLKLDTQDNIIKFIKIWFGLKRELSAVFLYHAIQRAKLYLNLGKEPIFNSDRLWYFLEKDYILKHHHKNHVITELVSKGIIKSFDNRYKNYMLNTSNKDLMILVDYLYQHYFNGLL
jgi:hypothetical protein